MSDAVIEIKVWSNTGACDYRCTLFCKFYCVAGWDDSSRPEERYGHPTDKCPGPGRYRLVRVEEE